MDRSEHAPLSHMMLGRERLFYTGLLGNSMRPRRMGSVAIYAARTGSFSISIDGGPFRKRRIIALAPFVSHRLFSHDGHILNICIEPESIETTVMADLLAEFNDASNSDHLAVSIQAARGELLVGTTIDGFSTAEFDHHFFGRCLANRRVDARIARALDLLAEPPQDLDLSASHCADRAGLSVSRFLHLFKENTGIPFRSQRMWKRARRFMDYANRDDSLTVVALDLGYPDSSHFSHSIRSSFGLQPRSIQRGSRGMKLSVGAGYDLSWSAAA